MTNRGRLPLAVVLSKVVPKTSSGSRGDKATKAGSPGGKAQVRSSVQGVRTDIVASKYRLDGPIDSAGKGEAVHVDLGTKVALVFASPKDANDERAAERFLSAARFAAQLRSQHARRVLDCGLDEGEPYLVLEYLEGADLRSIIGAHGSLPVEEALSFVLQACEALGEAHSRGVVHSDVKAENLFLTRGPLGDALIKVLGFGIARQPPASAVDARTDVWSLGVLLYELLTGELPSQDEPTARSPHDLNASISKGLAGVVLQCLEAKPDARFADVGALGRALKAFGASASSVTAARVDDILQRAHSIRVTSNEGAYSLPVAPESASTSSLPRVDPSPHVVPTPPRLLPKSVAAAPPPLPLSSAADPPAESVRNSWLMDAPAPELPTASGAGPMTPSSMPSLPAGPASRTEKPPTALPASRVPPATASKWKWPTKEQRPLVAGVGGLIVVMIIAFLWPHSPGPTAEVDAPPAAPTVAGTVIPEPSALASAAASASPAPPPSEPKAPVQTVVTEPASSAAPPPPSAAPRPARTPAPAPARLAPTLSRERPRSTTVASEPAPHRVRQRASSLYPVPKPPSL